MKTKQIQLMDDKIQELLIHAGHIGTSDKIKPMQEFSINFNYCDPEKQNDPSSTCFYCYAKDSRKNKFWSHYLDENTELMLNDPKWVKALSFYINNIGRNRQFRFFVAGEIPNKAALKKIMQVVKNCADCDFWIPTTKHDLVFDYIDNFGKPKNAMINLSWTDLKNEPSKKFINKCKRYNVKYTCAVLENSNCHADNTISHNCEYCKNCITEPSLITEAIKYKLKIKSKAKKAIYEKMIKGELN